MYKLWSYNLFKYLSGYLKYLNKLYNHNLYMSSI